MQPLILLMPPAVRVYSNRCQRRLRQVKKTACTAATLSCRSVCAHSRTPFALLLTSYLFVTSCLAASAIRACRCQMPVSHAHCALQASRPKAKYTALCAAERFRSELCLSIPQSPPRPPRHCMISWRPYPRKGNIFLAHTLRASSARRPLPIPLYARDPNLVPPPAVWRQHPLRP